MFAPTKKQMIQLLEATEPKQLDLLLRILKASESLEQPLSLLTGVQLLLFDFLSRAENWLTLEDRQQIILVFQPELEKFVALLEGDQPLAGWSFTILDFRYAAVIDRFNFPDRLFDLKTSEFVDKLSQLAASAHSCDLGVILKRFESKLEAYLQRGK